MAALVTSISSSPTFSTLATEVSVYSVEKNKNNQESEMDTIKRQNTNSDSVHVPKNCSPTLSSQQRDVTAVAVQENTSLGPGFHFTAIV